MAYVDKNRIQDIKTLADYVLDDSEKFLLNFRASDSIEDAARRLKAWANRQCPKCGFDVKICLCYQADEQVRRVKKT